MEGTTITIDLDRLVAEDSVTIRDQIIGECARRLLHDDAEIRDLVKVKAARLIDEQMRPVFAAMVEEALGAVIQPGTKWGEPQGEPLTFRSALVKRVEGYLSEPEPNQGLSSSRGRLTRVEAFIQREVKQAVEGDLKAAMDEARDKVRSAVRDSAADVIAQTVTRMVVR